MVFGLSDPMWEVEKYLGINTLLVLAFQGFKIWNASHSLTLHNIQKLQSVLIRITVQELYLELYQAHLFNSLLM